MTPRTGRRWLWVALTCAVLLGAYSCAGVVMAATLTGSRTAAYIYLTCLAISMVAAAAVSVALWRRRARK